MILVEKNEIRHRNSPSIKASRIKNLEFPCRELIPGHGGENAKSKPLDHIGILRFVHIEFPSMPAARGHTHIANTIVESLKNSALAGNRTPVSHVAGENSNTEPPTLKLFYSIFTILRVQYQCQMMFVGKITTIIYFRDG